MDKKKIGCFISSCRKDLGYTQNQLAEKLGVSNKAISKWETGEGYPDIETIPELCEELGITSDEFFKGEKNKAIINKKSIVVDNEDSSFENENNINYENINFKNNYYSTHLNTNKFKLSHKLSYIIFFFVVYFVIPISLGRVVENYMIYWLVYFIPAICFITGIHYGNKHGINLYFALFVALGFLPIYNFLVLIDYSYTSYIPLAAIIYGTMIILGSILAIICKKVKKFYLIKNERIY